MIIAIEHTRNDMIVTNHGLLTSRLSNVFERSWICTRFPSVFHLDDSLLLFCFYFIHFIAYLEWIHSILVDNHQWHEHGTNSRSYAFYLTLPIEHINCRSYFSFSFCSRSTRKWHCYRSTYVRWTSTHLCLCILSVRSMDNENNGFQFCWYVTHSSSTITHFWTCQLILSYNWSHAQWIIVEAMRAFELSTLSTHLCLWTTIDIEHWLFTGNSRSSHWKQCSFVLLFSFVFSSSIECTLSYWITIGMWTCLTI
jgi:hypothetical protein